MASPTPRRPRPTNTALPDVVDPRWLLKALALTIAAALICAYLAVCLLVWQGAWQLVLHPTATITRTPTIPFETVHFDAAATGKPRLTAWWIPAGRPAANVPTLLFLHDGTANLSANIDKLTLLHTLNLNILALDYRGFGQSDGPHPTELRMREDTIASLVYLADTRHIPAKSIIPLGVGLGAALAANLVQTHPELPALILDAPDPTLATRTIHDRRSTLIPTGLLLQDRFDLTPTLPALTVPKLVLLPAATRDKPQPDSAFLASIPAPKVTVTLPPAGAPSSPSLPDLPTAYTQAISRFLDQYPIHP